MIKSLFEDLTYNIASSKKDISDVIISIIPNVFSAISALLISILLARGLGPKSMGQYALVYSIYSLIPMLSDLGINQAAIRYASKAVARNDIDEQHAILRWTFRIRMFVLAITTATIIAISPYITEHLWHIPQLTNLLRISLIIGIFTAIMMIPHIYFQSQRLFTKNTIIYVIQYTISIIGIILLALFQKWSLSSVIFISIISSAIAAFIFISSVPKDIFYKAYNFPKSLKKVLIDFFKAPELKKNENGFNNSNIYSFTFYANLFSILCIIYINLDIWMMGFFLPLKQVGIYSVAARFSMPLTFIIGGIGVVLYPKASSFNTHTKTIKLIKKTFQMSVLLAVLFLIYSIFVPLLVPFIFGNTYKSCILVAQLLCFRYCISILFHPIGIIGYNYGFEKFYTLITAFTLLFCIIFNLLFLPRIGIFAPALSLVISEIFTCILITILLLFKVLREKI